MCIFNGTTLLYLFYSYKAPGFILLSCRVYEFPQGVSCWRANRNNQYLAHKYNIISKWFHLQTCLVINPQGKNDQHTFILTFTFTLKKRSQIAYLFFSFFFFLNPGHRTRRRATNQISPFKRIAHVTIWLYNLLSISQQVCSTRVLSDWIV